MKKVILLVLSVALALGSAVIASADANPGRALYGKVGFDKAVGVVGRSFLAGDIGSETNEIREDWTNSRGLADANAMFVNIGTESDPNVAVEFTGTGYASADFNENYAGEGAHNLVAYVDLKLVKDATFAGLVLDSTENGSYGSGNTEFNATHEKFILTSGYGFSLRAGNKVELFVNASPSDTVDSAVFDLGAYGLDSSEFITYALYRTTDKVVYLTANNVLIGKIDFSLAECAIFDAAGNNKANDTNDNYNESGKPFFAVVGDGDTDIYMDNIGYEEFTALPAFDSYNPAKLENVALCNGTGITSLWLQGDVGTYAAVAVNALSDLYGFSLPICWSSNPGNASHAAIDVKVEVFNFDTDLATSFTGTPAYSVTRTYDHDLATGDSFNFGKALPAGKYVIKFTILTKNGVDGKSAYFVLPGNEDLIYDGFHYIYSGISFNLTLKMAKASEYLGIVGTTETVAYSGASDGDGGKAHQLTGGGPLAVLLSIPEGKTLVGIQGHAPTWADKGSGIVAKVYAWAGSYDASVAGEVLASASIENYSEAQAWAFLNFDKAVPAGQYLVLFTAGNEHHVGFWNTTTRGNEILKVFRGTGMAETDYTPVLKVVRGLAEEAPETEGPETEGPETLPPATEAPETEAPQTGDMTIAMFAVVAIAAMAAVVVFKKRVVSR